MVPPRPFSLLRHRGTIAEPNKGADFVERVQTQLDGVPTAGETARVFLRSALHTWELDGFGDIVELLTSELVNNAVRHVGSSINLRALRHGSRIRVEVDDASRSTPIVRNPQPVETGGRGLLIVDALATEWGTDVHENGKTVWFELDVAAPNPVDRSP